jgi:hypothetical protein
MLKPWLGHQKSLTWGPSAISYQVFISTKRWFFLAEDTIINGKEARQIRCTPALSANASRISGANLPRNCTRTHSIFKRSAGYALFVLVITATKLLCMRVKMVMDRFRPLFWMPLFSDGPLFSGLFCDHQKSTKSGDQIVVLEPVSKV